MIRPNSKNAPLSPAALAMALSEDPQRAFDNALLFDDLASLRSAAQAGADLQKPQPPDRSPPIAIAAKRHQWSVVLWLAEQGVDLNACSDDGRRALMLCSREIDRQERIPAMARLLELGADPNAADDEGDAAAHWAALFAREAQDEPKDIQETLRILLLAGADPTARNAKGQDVFDLLNEEGAYPESAAWLRAFHLSLLEHDALAAPDACPAKPAKPKSL